MYYNSPNYNTSFGNLIERVPDTFSTLVQLMTNQSHLFNSIIPQLSAFDTVIRYDVALMLTSLEISLKVCASLEGM